MFAKLDSQQTWKLQSKWTSNQQSRHLTAKQIPGLAEKVPSPELVYHCHNQVHDLSEGLFGELPLVHVNDSEEPVDSYTFWKTNFFESGFRLDIPPFEGQRAGEHHEARSQKPQHDDLLTDAKI